MADGPMFHGMTINNILEKVDLLNFMFDEDENGSKKKEGESSGNKTMDKTVIKTSDPTSAYLGPKLWNNAISLDDLMDDESGDNNIIMNDVLYNSNSSPTGSPMMTGNQSPPSSPESFDIKPLIRPSIIVPVRSKFHH